MTDPDEIPTPAASGGLMINRGARLTISNIGISFGPDGVSASDPTITVSIDLTPYWLEIAVSQVRAATEQHERLLQASRAGNNDLVSAVMEAECKASMQAFAAAGIALDAFYAAVKEQVPIPEALIAQWRKNRTARYKQIAEVFRRAFDMDPRSAVRLRTTMREVFDFRDRAVHPPAVARQAVLYEELAVGTEWRFVAFRAHNARLATSAALSIVAQLLARPRIEHSSLVEFCRPALTNIQPTVDEWEKEFGQLYARSASRDAV
jgi:hypothetical protein